MNKWWLISAAKLSLFRVRTFCLLPRARFCLEIVRFLRILIHLWVSIVQPFCPFLWTFWRIRPMACGAFRLYCRGSFAAPYRLQCYSRRFHASARMCVCDHSYGLVRLFPFATESVRSLRRGLWRVPSSGVRLRLLTLQRYNNFPTCASVRGEKDTRKSTPVCLLGYWGWVSLVLSSVSSVDSFFSTAWL